MSKGKIENTLVLLKPDAVAKHLTGYILTRLAALELSLLAAKCVVVPKEVAEEHYQNIRKKPFFDETVQFLIGKFNSSAHVVALIFQGENAISKIRELAGATNPEDAQPNSLRGQMGRITTKGIFENVIHASSSIEDAEREIKLWFSPSEIVRDLYPTKTIQQTSKQLAWK